MEKTKRKVEIDEMVKGITSPLSMRVGSRLGVLDQPKVMEAIEKLIMTAYMHNPLIYNGIQYMLLEDENPTYILINLLTSMAERQVSLQETLQTALVQQPVKLFIGGEMTDND